MKNPKQAKAQPDNGKAKATKLDISQLVITSAYEKKFSSGKQGFFGKAMDPRNGDRYQIVGAVKIG